MTMQLITWLELQKMSIKEFAKKIGKHPSLVHKYIYADVIPMRDPMKKIFITTDGLVSANDFHQLTEEVLKQELAKRKKIASEPEMDFSK
ncbi:helix-turn-helix domain-containing protein [Candidatus Tisiphia endosymbiont of Hybos culiciformis]|uniref:helix-turn-helix domain-containing protein n=1 Tax=Candidatus Tisiphia endosymbiont of Hybos culiciformis TaxID=3139331 RepID=UPI003CCB28EC